MGHFRWDQIDVMVLDPDRGARDSIRNILFNSGFRDVRLCTGLADAERQLALVTPDLLIGECEFADGELASLVSSLRHHKVGENPFLSVIALTWTPTQEMVRSIINSGVDDLLTKPISSNHLLERIRILIEARRPFVVTSDYVGPDRHVSSIRENTVPLIDAPNTLKIKASGKKTKGDATDTINSAIMVVDRMKLERHAIQIGGLVELIVPGLEKDGVNQTVRAYFDRLLVVAEDTSRRSTEAGYAQISELCQSLIEVAGTVLASKGSPDAKNIKVLKPLSQAIRAGLDCTEDAASVARVISRSISDRRFFADQDAKASTLR